MKAESDPLSSINESINPESTSKTRIESSTPATQLREFMSRYSPTIARKARAILNKMRTRLPGATELVYDNYNALVIGFGPSERASEAIFSIVLFPRWVSLFFLDGKGLPDPEGLLRGKGAVVRHIVLDDETMMDQPAVQALMTEALKRARRPIIPGSRKRLIIKSISGKQRPRRPTMSHKGSSHALQPEKSRTR